MNCQQAGPRKTQASTEEFPLGAQSHQERKLDFLTKCPYLLLKTTRCSGSCWLVSGELEDQGE